MPNVENNSPDRENKGEQRETEEQPESEFESSRGVTDRLGGRVKNLLKSGKEGVSWVLKRFGLSKEEEQSMEEELGEVKGEADEVLASAGEELGDDDYEEITEDMIIEEVHPESEEIDGKAGTKVAGLRSKRDLGSQAAIIESDKGRDTDRELVRAEIDSVKDLPQKLSGLERTQEITDISNEELNSKIYSEILLVLADRAESIKTEEAISIDEKDGIRNSLTFLFREGVDPIESLSKLTADLYTRRSRLEIELNPRTEGEKNNIEKDIKVLEDIRDNGMPVNKFDNIKDYKGVFEEGKMMEFIDSEENIADILEDPQARTELDEKQKKAIQDVIDERNKLLRDPPVGAEKNALEVKIDNLTETLKIVSATQKVAKRKRKQLREIYDDQTHFTELARKYNIGPKEMSPVVKLKKEREESFVKGALKPSDISAEDTYKRFIKGLVDEVREAA